MSPVNPSRSSSHFQEGVTDLAFTLAGSLLLGFGLYNFSIKAGFAPIGLGGLASLLSQITGLPLGMLNLALNLPLVPFCWRVLGRAFVGRSLVTMLIITMFTDGISPLFPAYEGDSLWAAVFSGFCIGLGQALIYLRGSSTGGMDFVTLPARKLWPRFSVGQVNLFAHTTVVFLSGLYYRQFNSALATVLCMGVCTLVLDHVIAGSTAGKAVFIITDHAPEICCAVGTRLIRGCTRIPAVGGYTGQSREIVLCYCSGPQLGRLQTILKDVDPHAMVACLNAGEVSGFGFPASRVPGSQYTAEPYTQFKKGEMTHA